MRKFLVLAITLSLAAPAGAQLAPGPKSDGADAISQSEINKLIKDLGDDRWKVRDAASRRLREIGWPAVPALREAVKNPDLEVKVRAKSLLTAICRVAPDELAEMRAELQKAFRAADYPAAIRVSRKLTSYENCEMLDWLWCGHVCQLGGQWADAVQAYRKVVEFVDEDISDGVKKTADGKLPPPGALVRGKVVVMRPVAPPGPIALSTRERKALINQRSILMLWIARMQSVELKDAKSAAKTLAEALDYLDATKTEIDYFWIEIVKAYPLMAHRTGDVPAAVAAWKRSVATRAKSKYGGDQLVDVELIHKALCALPEDAPRPEVPWIISLGDSDETTTKLDFADANTLARRYRPGTYDHYALAPPRGKEFATIEFACDIEQFNVRYGGQFSCFVMAHDPPDKQNKLGDIGWTNRNKPGREVIKKTIAIPPGAGLAHIQIGTPKQFKVHSVSAKATFRPTTKDAAPILAGAWMQTKLHPANSRITWGEMTMQNERAYSGVRPGRHTLRLTAPGRDKTIELPYEVKPGRRYGLVFNLDSPFRRQQLDLELSGRHPVNPPRFSIQRLGEAGHIAVWGCLGGKLMAAQSKDLVNWTKPEPLPFSSVFDNIEPASFRTPDGTIYLTFFSNRLSPQSVSSAGYHLWLTSTRDGKTWAPIRRIEIGSLGGWPASSASMVTGPSGKQWIFWRDMAGSAKTLDGVEELTPIQVQGRNIHGKEVNLWNVHVVVDNRKQFRMVCDDFGEAICHLTSADGRSWSQPQPLVKRKEKDRGPSLTDQQLILIGGKEFLLYGGTYLLELDMKADAVFFGEGIKVSSYLAPLAGARAFCKGDEVFVMTGTETTWMLRAKLKDILAATTGK